MQTCCRRNTFVSFLPPLCCLSNHFSFSSAIWKEKASLFLSMFPFKFLFAYYFNFTASFFSISFDTSKLYFKTLLYSIIQLLFWLKLLPNTFAFPHAFLYTHSVSSFWDSLYLYSYFASPTFFSRGMGGVFPVLF